MVVIMGMVVVRVARDPVMIAKVGDMEVEAAEGDKAVVPDLINIHKARPLTYHQRNQPQQ